MAQSSLPLREGVPQWIGVCTILLIMVITATMNGISLSSAPEFAGALSVVSDDITMSYYSTSVGLCIIYPIVRFFNLRNTPKTLLLVGLIAEVILALVSAKTDNVTVLTIACFFTGIAKGILLLTCLGMIRPFITPSNRNSTFISWLIPFSMGVGQLSTFTTEWFTLYFEWHYIYYVIIVLSLLAILSVLIFFKYANLLFHFPYGKIDYTGVFLITLTLLGFVYICAYGKNLDWFNSPKIVTAAIFTLLVFIIFLIQNNYSSKPYIRLWQLVRWEGLLGYGFMVLVMFFNASSSVINSYMSSVLKIDNLHSAQLNLWVIPGYIVGGIVCYLWHRYLSNIRGLVVSGMFCYLLYFAIAYLNVASDARYQSLELAVFFKGVGMIILIANFIIYLTRDLKYEEKPSHLFYNIGIRGVLAPVLWAAVVSTTLYRGTQGAIVRLVDTIRLDNITSYDQYMKSYRSAIAGGHGDYESMQMAVSSLYNTLNSQATLLTVKQLLGIFLLVAVITTALSIILPYKNHFKRDLVKRPSIETT